MPIFAEVLCHVSLSECLRVFLAINSAMQATITEGLHTIKEELEELGPPRGIMCCWIIPFRQLYAFWSSVPPG